MTQDHTQDDNKPSDAQPDLSRRKFMNTAALVGLSGAGLSLGLSACNKKTAPATGEGAGTGAAPAAQAGSDIHYSKYEVPPGKLDEYYSF